MNLYKTKSFARWAKKEKIGDDVLKNTIQEITAGMAHAKLGSGLIKQRLPRIGQGKRGGYRTVIACKENEGAFFLIGFSKNARSNLHPHETTKYRKISRWLLEASNRQIRALCEMNELEEIR